MSIDKLKTGVDMTKKHNKCESEIALRIPYKFTVFGFFSLLVG